MAFSNHGKSGVVLEKPSGNTTGEMDSKRLACRLSLQ